MVEEVTMLFDSVASTIISLVIIRLISQIVNSFFYLLHERDKRNSVLQFNQLVEKREKQEEEKRQEEKCQEEATTKTSNKCETRRGFCIHIHGKEILADSDDESDKIGKGLNDVYHRSSSGSIPSAESASSRSSISQMSHEEKIQAVQDELSKISEGDYSSIELIT
jgi:hypothetical protein